PESNSSGQNFIEMTHIRVVFNAIGQSHVQAALFLAEGEVAGAVDGEGEDARIVLKYLRRSVTLMNIEINHGGATDKAAFSQEMNCHGDIVEPTEAGSFWAESMMRTSPQSRAPAVLKCLTRRADGPANRCKCPLHQIR